MKRLLLPLILLLSFPCLSQSLMSGSESLFCHVGFNGLERPAYLLPSELAVQAGTKGCGLLSCFTGSPVQESTDRGRTGYDSERRTAKDRSLNVASGGGEPPDDPSDKEEGSNEEMLVELERVLQLMIELIRAGSNRLVLCFDIDRTVFYLTGRKGLHGAYSNRWEGFLKTLRQERRLLLIYNTARPPGTMQLSQDDWSGLPYPEPDIMIMGGSQVQYSQNLQQEYPGLQNMASNSQTVWPSLEPGEESSGASLDQTGSYCRVVCSPGSQAAQVEERMQAFCAGRTACNLWRQTFNDGQNEVVFAYDQNASKGAALSRVMNQLDQQQVFGSDPVLLITAGDDIPDASMMNPDMCFQPGSEACAPAPIALPGNVQFVGSVIAHDANLLIPELRQFLLPEGSTKTVVADEASLLGIQKGVVELLQQHQASDE